MATLPPGTSLDAAARDRIDALVELFRKSAEQLAEIEKALAAGTFRRRYVRARLREAQAIIDNLLTLQSGRASGELITWAREHFPETYRMGAGMAVRDLKAQAVRVVSGDPRIHTRAVGSLVGRYMSDATEIIVQLHANAIRTSRIFLAQAGFGQEIASGIIGGLPRRETSKLLRQSLLRSLNLALPEGAEPDLTSVQIGKRTFSIDTWAEMHARTETARASTAGTRVLSAVNGVAHVQITSHAHAPCICTPYEGRIYSLAPDDPRFPWIGEVPGGGVPLHPNCVHREAPAVVEFLEARGEVAGRDQIPAEFRGLSEAELARKVRENRDQLRRYSEDRDGMLPEGFKLRKAA